jgi:putative transposase
MVADPSLDKGVLKAVIQENVLGLAGMRKDLAFACQQFAVSERRACKLLGMDRGSYRLRTQPDRNGPLGEALVSLAWQKPRYRYRRLHALLRDDEHPATVMRICSLYRAEGLAVRRLKRKRLSRVAVASHLVRSNQQWALDFACDSGHRPRYSRTRTSGDGCNGENQKRFGATTVPGRPAGTS